MLVAAHDGDSAVGMAVHDKAGIGQDARQRHLGAQIAAHAMAAHAADGLVGHHKRHAGLRGVGVERGFQRAAGNVEFVGQSGRRQRQHADAADQCGFQYLSTFSFSPLSARCRISRLSARSRFHCPGLPRADRTRRARLR